MQLIVAPDVTMAEAVQVLDCVVAEVVGQDKGAKMVIFAKAFVYCSQTILTEVLILKICENLSRRYFAKHIRQRKSINSFLCV